MSKRKIGICNQCNQEKQIYTKGMCRSCAGRLETKTRKALNTVFTEAENVERVGLSLVEYAAQAKQKLMAALPDAADAMVKAMAIAASKGNSKPAETLLREYAISDDGKQRILQSQFSAGQLAHGSGDAGLKVYIGVSLGGVKQPSLPALAQSAVVDAQVITGQQDSDKRNG